MPNDARSAILFGAAVSLGMIAEQTISRGDG